MLKRIILALAVLLLPASFAAAEPSAADREAIRSVIEQQLNAFQRDDANEAFSYASPTIKQKFGDPANFMEMVREGYETVYRPGAVEFRKLGMVHGRLAQRVFMTGPDGRAMIAFYFMEKQEDGSWRIDGVRMMPAPDAAV